MRDFTRCQRTPVMPPLYVPMLSGGNLESIKLVKSSSRHGLSATGKIEEKRTFLASVGLQDNKKNKNMLWKLCKDGKNNAIPTLVRLSLESYLAAIFRPNTTSSTTNAPRLFAPLQVYGQQLLHLFFVTLLSDHFKSRTLQVFICTA